ncbi:MAG: 3-phosphoshikimate 1-carboxyvinyltransferase [Firmicutes bacterium]|nr:3-phosphoshikimate 1-carboxyvinyltransferase [Bacillota bacterium]
MNVIISKTGYSGTASAKLPPSKSVSHRLLIAAALAEGTSRIYNMARNKDIEATVRCLRRLGVAIDDSGDPVLVTGPADLSAYDGKELDCGESASTLRFLLPLFAQSGRRCIFTGRGRLMERPEDVYEEIYGKTGEFVRICGSELTECFSQQIRDSFPGLISAKGPLEPGVFTVRGDISSQFISGLLFLLPLLEADSRIDVLPPFGSAPYVDLTIKVLKTAGIKTELRRPAHSERTDICPPAASIYVPGGQKYKAFEANAEADWSSAAVFAVLSLLLRRPVLLEGADPASLHADRAVLDFMEKFGAKCSAQEPGASAEPAASGVLIEPPAEGAPLRPVNADLWDCPDLGPVLFAAATQAEGTSVFRSIKRLRLKESNRVFCMQEELRKLGCSMRADEDTAYIDGPVRIRGGCTLSSCGDHRIAMALSVLACCADEPITIEGAEAVAKSWPGFFEALAACGAGVTIQEPGEKQ